MTYSRLSTFVAPAILASTLALASEARAVTFDFNSSGQFASNFEAYNVSNASLAQSDGRVTLTTGGAQTASFIYDSNGSAPGGITNFLPGAGNSVVVEFDFSANVNNSGFGVFFGGTRTSENLALFNINNSGSTNDQLRIFSVQNWNATTPASLGTTTSPAASLVTGTGTNGWTTSPSTASVYYHAKFTMTYTSSTTADISYVISDPANSLSSISVSALNFAVSSTANEIGFRMGSGNSASILSIDNISIITTSPIPEPSAFAALAGIATLGFAASRRRRAA